MNKSYWNINTCVGIFFPLSTRNNSFCQKKKSVLPLQCKINSLQRRKRKKQSRKIINNNWINLGETFYHRDGLVVQWKTEVECHCNLVNGERWISKEKDMQEEKVEKRERQDIFQGDKCLEKSGYRGSTVRKTTMGPLMLFTILVWSELFNSWYLLY